LGPVLALLVIGGCVVGAAAPRRWMPVLLALPFIGAALWAYGVLARDTCPDGNDCGRAIVLIPATALCVAALLGLAIGVLIDRHSGHEEDPPLPG
jgi:hypothetical protein